METHELLLWAFGVIVSIVFGVAGLKAYRGKSTQIQKTGKNSVSIQSGRDTKIENDG